MPPKLSPIQIEDLQKKSAIAKFAQAIISNPPRVGKGKEYDTLALRIMSDLLKAHNTLIEKMAEFDAIIAEKKGDKGDPGINGITPERGVDYMTEDDITMIAEMVYGMIDVQNGEPGKDSDTPTREYLLSLIEPLIPQVKDGEPGKTPTKKELLAIIKPLIPTLDSTTIINTIMAQIRMEMGSSIKAPSINEVIDTIKKEKHITLGHVHGLEEALTLIKRNHANSMRGGGDTVVAGSGVSITPNQNGNKVISIQTQTSVYEEIPSGSGTTFTLAHTPTANTLRLFRGGARQQLTGDYTLVGDQITLSVALQNGEILLADYQY